VEVAYLTERLAVAAGRERWHAASACEHDRLMGGELDVVVWRFVCSQQRESVFSQSEDACERVGWCGVVMFC